MLLHTHTHVYVCVCVYIYIYIYIGVCVCVYVRARTDLCTYVAGYRVWSQLSGIIQGELPPCTFKHTIILTAKTHIRPRSCTDAQKLGVACLSCTRTLLVNGLEHMIINTRLNEIINSAVKNFQNIYLHIEMKSKKVKKKSRDGIETQYWIEND